MGKKKAKLKAVAKQTMSVVAVDTETRDAIVQRLRTDIDTLTDLVSLAEGLTENTDLGGFIIPPEWIQGIGEVSTSVGAVAGEVAGAPEGAVEEPTAGSEHEDEATQQPGVEAEEDEEEEPFAAADHLDEDEETAALKSEHEDDELDKSEHEEDEEPKALKKLTRLVLKLGKNQATQLKALNEVSRVVKHVFEQFKKRAEVPDGTERAGNGPIDGTHAEAGANLLPIDVPLSVMKNPGQMTEEIEKRVAEFTDGASVDAPRQNGEQQFDGTVVQFPVGAEED